MANGQERTVDHEDVLLQLGWVQRLARRLAGDANVAADVTQEVWLKTQGRDMDSTKGLRRWLRALTRGLVRDARREADRRATRERVAARHEAQPSASEVVERNALQQRVSAAVMELEEPYRSTVLYRYMDDLSTGEIAKRMSVSEEAVRQRLTRARKTLKARLDCQFGGGSGAWALAILGSVPAERVAAATSGAGGVSAASTSTGSSVVMGMKAAAVGAAALGSVAVWRGLTPSEEADPVQKEARAAVVTYDWDEDELAEERSRSDQRGFVRSLDEPPTLVPLDEPDNEYVLAPLQMW